MRKNRVFFWFSLFITFMAVMTMNNKGTYAAQLAPHLYKSTLDNGLKVIVKETPGTNAATVQIWVKAGSVFEQSEEAGITHFIEHMIFKGTDTRGPGALAEAIEGVGGRINAYTSFESTVYHATLSSRHWAMALDVLVDAVLNSIFDSEEVEREKKVVLEELGMRNDRPNIKLFQELLSNAYMIHPYRLPVIGSAESISSFSREKILSYIEKHYQPHNMTVVVVGNVQQVEVLDKVKNLMGHLVRTDMLDNALPREPRQKQPRKFVIEGDIKQAQMAVALPISPFDSPDTPVLDVISHILGQGETSRLYRTLRDEKQLVFGIDSSAFTPHDPGMLEVFAVLDEGNMLAALEVALVELFKLKYISVAEEELRRAKLNLESDFVFNLERVEGQARMLGSFESLAGDPREDEYLEAIRTVTLADIKKTATEYFSDKRVTAGFLVPTGSAFELSEEAFTEVLARADETASKSSSAALISDSFLSGLHRFELENGAILLVREENSVATVGIRAVFPGGLRSELLSTNGAFAFISELLPKGTSTKSAREIAMSVADKAGSINGFNGKNTFGIKADYIARFLEDGLDLVSDILRNPAFNAEEADKIRPELLARLKQQEDSLTGLAFREFNRMLFDGHPYGLNTAGSEEVITGLTPADLREIYHRHAKPEKLVLAVSGAVKAEEVRDLVEKLFGDWLKTGTEPDIGFQEEILPPDAPKEPNHFTIARDKEQVHLVIGFLGTTLDSKDRYGLEVLDTLLSGQSGRLFTELRDKQSLAYSLSSFSLFGLDTGAFGIYIGTSPDKKDQAIQEVWKELERVREHKINEDELQRAKNILISQYELGLQTHSAQALEMALNETYLLGQNFGNIYIDEINKVDAESVLNMAQKYILPEKYVMISVGAEHEGNSPQIESGQDSEVGEEKAQKVDEQQL